MVDTSRPAVSATTPGTGTAAARRRRERLARHALQVVILLVFLGLWQLASGRWVQPLFISSPLAVGETVATWVADGTLLHHAVETFRVAVIGFFVGGVTAVVLGYLLGVSRFWSGVMDPFITALYALPKVAIIPLLIIWVGIGSGLAVVVCALIVFLLLFYNTFYGIREVSADLINSVRIMGGGWAEVAFTVRLPSAFVWILAGMRISVPQALVGVVTAEILAGNRGLGYLVSFNAGQFNTAGTLAAVFVLLLIGWLLDRVVSLASRRALAWQGREGR